MIGTALLFAVGGLAIAEVPPFGTFLGKTLIEDAASRAGYHWMPWVFGIAAAVTGGAILRATGRIFLGLGPHERARFASDRTGEDDRPAEERRGRDRTPSALFVPAAVLITAGLAVGLLPGLAGQAERAAARFEDRPAYARAVLYARPVSAVSGPSVGPSALGAWYGVASGVGAVALASVALLRRRFVPSTARRRVAAVFGPPIRGVRALQSGHVGDYAAWFAVGLAAMGGLLAAAVR